MSLVHSNDGILDRDNGLQIHSLKPSHLPSSDSFLGCRPDSPLRHSKVRGSVRNVCSWGHIQLTELTLPYRASLEWWRVSGSGSVLYWSDSLLSPVTLSSGPLVTFSIHIHTVYNVSQALAQWSSGMIPASGAGGPGFKSRLSPQLCFLRTQQRTGKYSNVEWALSDYLVKCTFLLTQLNLQSGPYSINS